MNHEKRQQVQYGDFQTPAALASEVCRRLEEMGIKPDVVIEPTCGMGSFVEAAAVVFPGAQVFGYEINNDYLTQLKNTVDQQPYASRVYLQQCDFFNTDWKRIASSQLGKILVLGNFPWVTSAVLGAIGSDNLPEKSNFLKHKGFDAITGKANFDISEWMLIDLMQWLSRRESDLGMLVKTATARKVIAYAERTGVGVKSALIVKIDAKFHFNASVDACLLVMRFSGAPAITTIDYDVFSTLHDIYPTRVGHRQGLTVGDLDRFEANSHLLGETSQKWRSGVKHDASRIMEFTKTDGNLINGFGEIVNIEDTYLYPLMKGSDIGSSKEWRQKYVLITQRKTNESTDHIESDAPLTWKYLQAHGDLLDARGSTIYAKGPRFSIFGVGDYGFRLWKVAICGLYKKLNFRIIGPVENKPVMFDDTVYYVSFDKKNDAIEAYEAITSPGAIDLYSSLIFWDEKRPIKSSVLNNVDWLRCSGESQQHKGRARRVG